MISWFVSLIFTLIFGFDRFNSVFFFDVSIVKILIFDFCIPIILIENSVMGQNNSSGTIAENLIPNTIDLVQYELTKQIHALTEINDLSYDDFQKCLLELNEL